ncbi:MAG TPA: hypothetical protein VES89_06285 [Candidatus Competibacteraceae bacterium]|nr:hypothetical protein [Candidatus Competibacteraceae bacterium]
MSDCQPHEAHPHQHGPGCGHPAIRHQDHLDYLHEGHLHHPHGDHYDEHRLEISATHPGGCETTTTTCCQRGHQHGPGCGHEPVPHGDHLDYLVEGRLHHPHGDHGDGHRKVEFG